MGTRGTGLTDERRGEILVAVVELIAEHGVSSVRLSDVAARCGVSVGALQHHFATREQLIDEAFYAYTLGVVRQIQELSAGGGDPWKRIMRALAAYGDVGDFRQRSRLWVEFGSSAARSERQRERIAAIHAEWARPFVEAIDDGVADGLFTPVADSVTIAQTILATMDGYDLAYAAGIIDLGAAGVDVVERLAQMVAAQLGVEAAGIRPGWRQSRHAE